jgi:predicted RNA-binding Zn-ribbon protein involved in translation (DUF1610 family)
MSKKAIETIMSLCDPDYRDGFCPYCGERLELVKYSEGDDLDGNRGWVREQWECPGCGEVGVISEATSREPQNATLKLQKG